MSQIQSTIAVGGCCVPAPVDAANPTHASTTMVGGQAVFENDNYRITMGDNNQVAITNKHTGETYMACGDPHMYVDGQHAFDFWGTTTLQLDDGTKVTIQTTPWSQNANATLCSKVTITNGAYGVQVSGIDTNTTGDLQIHEAKGWGQVLDWAVDDGNVLQENPAGQGFLAVDDHGRIHAVDQTWINQTDLLKGGALEHRIADAFRQLVGLVSISLAGWLLGSVARSSGSEGGAARQPAQLGLSARGRALIERHEGLRLHAYQDSVGVWTIGYGHTHGVHRGQVISAAQADQLLRRDVRSAEAAVRASVKVPLTQGQFDALVSFTFNLGAGALKSSTLLKKLNAGDYAGAQKEFGKWVNAGGHRLEGLVHRRADEAQLFGSTGPAARAQAHPLPPFDAAPVRR